MIIVVGGVEVVVPDPPVIVDDGPVVQTLSWEWDSWNGDHWDLTAPGGFVTKTRGAAGWGMPDVTHIVDEFPLANGGNWQSARVPPRQLLLPVWVHAPDSETMKLVHNAFIQALNPWQLNTITITSFGGERRSIDVRYVSGADTPINLDPQAGHSILYVLTLLATQPFFRGDPVTREFKAPTALPRYPMPPVRINRSHTFGSAKINNPGHLPTSLQWVVNAPFSGFTVGVGGANIAMTLTRTAGHFVTIDTTPGRRRIVDDTGANLLSAVTAVEFADIDPGDNVPLTIDVPGTGAGTSVDASLDPLYWAGW